MKEKNGALFKCKKFWLSKNRIIWVKRFFSKINIIEDSCWEWNAGYFSDGYGCFAYLRKSFRAHCFSYRIFYGIIKKHKQINHDCNNKRCVNPHHLRSGTQKENMEYKVLCDRQSKGLNHGRYTKPEKTPRGINHHRSKINDGIVIKIRSEYISGIVTQRYLAKKYGLCQATISQIIRKVNWAHI